MMQARSKLSPKRPAVLRRPVSDSPPSPGDTAWMQQAIALAKRAGQMGEVPVGALVIHDGRVIGEGYNRREMDADPIAHAEIMAIAHAAKALGRWRLTDCTLVVTLEPCPMCAGAIVNARLNRLVYGAADPKMGAVKTLFRLCTDTRLNHRVEVTGGVLASACGCLLSDFFKARRKSKNGQP